MENTRLAAPRCLVPLVVWGLLATLARVSAAQPTTPPSDEEIAARLIGAALVDSQAYAKLAYLSDRIGHRLSGSAALERAVVWSVEQFQQDGADRVWTEELKVPHWVRGEADAGIVAPVEQRFALLALGGSVATPPDGLRAEVIEARDFEQLAALGDAVRGKIVLFNRALRPEAGSEHGYGAVARLRVDGASMAARQGAVGMLIRSLGTADYRLPHTGALRYKDDAPRIPAAAISAEDAELVHRLLAAGERVEVHLRLTCQTLPDATSANVLAEIRGRERPDEIVLIGAHLDTWDVGQGAHDDGAGCAIVMETLRLLKRQGLVPRRTIRAVLFTNEENGLRGGRDYAERHGDEHHVVAIESDGGGDAPVGFGITAGEGAVDMVRGIARHLRVLGADTVHPSGGGADISPLKDRGVPVMGLLQDPARYFDYHHTEADTLDKVDPAALVRNVAALATMTWFLAEQETTVPRP